MGSVPPVEDPIAVTVFTGFLGAGKTSIILSLLPRLPKDYKVVLLKNEFGDIEVDSQLAKQSSLTAVSEILNGCMCCVLVGQMKTALLEIRELYKPDRIIIECSGSAFPATLAFQIRELERETYGAFKLDAILTVIDAENFTGYEDTSPTAKMQASYTDLILINKWEHISERSLDILIDHLNTLNDLTPKLRCEGRKGLDPSLIFGIDSKLFVSAEESPSQIPHHDEVETVTVSSYPGATSAHKHGAECSCGSHDEGHHHNGAEEAPDITTQRSTLEKALSSLSKEVIWRVKGFVSLEDGRYILNWAFGRYDLTLTKSGTSSPEGLEGPGVRLTVMGERGEVKRAARKFGERLGLKGTSVD